MAKNGIFTGYPTGLFTGLPHGVDPEEYHHRQIKSKLECDDYGKCEQCRDTNCRMINEKEVKQ